MDVLNRLTTRAFDVLLRPFELLGVELSLILVSGLFGILALLVFKQISWQKGIKRVKDRIKGDMIAIRLYQDDLGIVGGSVLKIVLRNFQYLSLNLLPILPLMAPFVLVMAQLVVRYAYAPLPIRDAGAAILPGDGTTLTIELARGREREVEGMRVHLPPGLKPVSPLVRNAADGIACQEVIAVAPGEWEIEIELLDGSRGIKRVVTGDRPARVMQPERVAGFWSSWLFPAEDRFARGGPIERVSFDYPDRELRFLPDGELWIVVVFFVASMVFGALVLKPLGIQI